MFAKFLQKHVPLQHLLKEIYLGQYLFMAISYITDLTGTESSTIGLGNLKAAHMMHHLKNHFDPSR